MEKITAILREERLPVVLAALGDLGYGGITISQVRGHGRQRGVAQQWRGNEFRVDFLPKARIELVVGEAMTDKVIEAICENARTGAVGDGKVWVTPVTKLVRVRTGETGDAAI
ncbi:MAG TPA: P-II family nitrogen regulator [Dehalococcoidia bacterium]|nr:P-II family nitrogen regulator [Dehalococcoidia bacterium]